MTAKSTTALSILTLSAALLTGSARAQPEKPVAVKTDGSYNQMNAQGKVAYLTTVIDGGRQAAMALKHAKDDIQRAEDMKAKVQVAKSATAEAGLPTGAHDRKLADLERQIAELKAKAEVLRLKAEAMAAEARKRKAEDAEIHRRALAAVLRAENGGGEEPPPPGGTDGGRGAEPVTGPPTLLNRRSLTTPKTDK